MRCLRNSSPTVSAALLLALASGALAAPPEPMHLAPAPIELIAGRPVDDPPPMRLWAEETRRPRYGIVRGVFEDMPVGSSTGFAPAVGEVDNIHQVSFAAEGSDFDPTLSPDGSKLFYASTQHSFTSDIYVKPVNGRAITQLTNDPANDLMPAVSPDGSRVAFSSDRRGSWDLYIMSAEGGLAVQITDSAAHELHPTWSPDGRMIAYCKLGEVSGRWEIWVTEANNPGVRHFLGYGLLPEWSPVSNHIAFQRSREQGDRLFSVWTIEYSNGESRNLTQIASSPVAAIVNPSWSNDGSYLVFSAITDPDGPYATSGTEADIWIARADGTGLANLTGGGFLNISPFWGPDNSVYFVSDRSGNDNIWAVRPHQAIIAAGGTLNESNEGQTNLAEVDDN